MNRRLEGGRSADEVSAERLARLNADQWVEGTDGILRPDVARHQNMRGPDAESMNPSQALPFLRGRAAAAVANSLESN